MFEGLLQPTHLILILAIVLIIFGPGKLSGLGKTLGSSIREFRESVSEFNTASAPAVPTPAAGAPLVTTPAVNAPAVTTADEPYS